MGLLLQLQPHKSNMQQKKTGRRHMYALHTFCFKTLLSDLEA